MSADQSATAPSPLPSAEESRAAVSAVRHGAVVAYFFVGLFAFLLASFPARNPEIWGHLATGRDLLQGRAPQSVGEWAPQAIPGQGWLFDAATYVLFSLCGGTGLVVVKAVAVCGLSLIMFNMSRDDGSSRIIPTFCIGLAVLAMGPRLLLSPATASVFFLALTFWLLHKEKNQPFRFVHWPLLMLFFVWANTDRWFLVGLVLVASVWSGRALDQRRGSVFLRRIGALALLMAVCLLSPAHYHAFVIPPEIFAEGPMPGGTRGVRSPFDLAYLDAISEYPAGLAYFPLVGLGLLSFALSWRQWRWERFVPWVAFAIVSALQVRTVPFFAVVAGPVLAWNLEAFFAQRRATSRVVQQRQRWLVRVSLAGAIGLLGLAFLGSAWTGWLQSPPFEPRRWGIETPGSLDQCATAMCAWQAEGRLKSDDRVLHLSPDSAATLAWHCPEISSVRDPEITAGILSDSDGANDWASRMRAAGISHFVVYDTDWPRLYTVLERLFAAPEQWSLLHLQGKVTVFRWRDPSAIAPAIRAENPTAELNRLVLQPSPETRAPASTVTTRRLWWEAFWKPAPAPSGDRDEAALRLLQAEAERRLAPARHLAAWEATQIAGLIASVQMSPSVPHALFDTELRLAFFRPALSGSGGSSLSLGQLALAYHLTFARQREDTPIAILYLAIRAARRAIAHNPDDAQAFATLGEAYLRLLHNTRERSWSRSLPELARLRRAQAASAFHRALALDPNRALPHSQLGTLYFEMGFLDLALEHYRAYLDGLRKVGPMAGTQPEDYRAATEEAEQQLDRLARSVDERRAEFERESVGLRVLDRAILARDIGLAGKAREILLASDISAFGASGLALELELLIRTGRAQEVRDWTSPEHQDAIGPMYHWLRLQALAAIGEYALAEDECTLLASEGALVSGMEARVVMATLVGQSILESQRIVHHMGLPAWETFRQAAFRNQVGQLIDMIRREADVIAIRGLLALEAGQTHLAAMDFQQVLATWGSAEFVSEGRGLDFNARLMCQEALAWIESVPP